MADDGDNSHHSTIVGNVTIGDGVIIHPTAVISTSAQGSIIMGNGCVVEERCVIECNDKITLTIGEGNMFQVGCHIRAAEIGNHNVFGPKSEVADYASIGNLVEVGAGVHIPPHAKLSDGSVVFRNGKSGEQDVGKGRKTMEVGE